MLFSKLNLFFTRVEVQRMIKKIKATTNDIKNKPNKIKLKNKIIN